MFPLQTWWAWSEWWRSWVCQRLIWRWRKWSQRWRGAAVTPSTTGTLWKWCLASDQLFSNCKCVFKHVSVILYACSLSILFLILANAIMLNCRTISCFDWIQLFLDMSTCVCLILSAHPVQDRHICAIISQWERDLLWQVMSSPWDTRDWINTRNLALVQYKPLVPQYQY